MPERVLRVGLVGSGPWARLTVAPALAAAPEVRLTHGWSRNDADLADLARRHGFEPASTYVDLLDRVDVVAFCVPPDVQAGLTPAALDAGKALLLEKPVARRVEQAERLHGHPEPVLVHYSRLLDSTVAPWLDAAAERTWSSARAVLTNTATVGDDPFGRSAWRRETDGALWDLGPHVLAALQVALGDVTTVSARRTDEGIVLETTHARGASARSLVSVSASTKQDVLELVDADDCVHRLPPDPRQGGVQTYRALVSGLVPPSGPSRGPCAAAVMDPAFSTSVVATLVAASAALRAGPAA